MPNGEVEVKTGEIKHAETAACRACKERHPIKEMTAIMRVGKTCYYLCQKCSPWSQV